MQRTTGDITGRIYNLQRYNLHDGHGIRSILFLKGCPLRCLWCSNPESQRSEEQTMGERNVGTTMSVKEAVSRLARDKPFYDTSGGGVTISGGEPLAQPEFAQALAEEGKLAGLHMAIESSAWAAPHVFESVVKAYDLLLLDIKHMSDEAHKQATGVSNRLILDNIRRAASWGIEIIARVPVVPGINDDAENLEQTAAFCSEIRIQEMHLLPYHAFGTGKYQLLGMDYTLHDVQPPDKEELGAVAEGLTRRHGLMVKVI